MFHNNGILALIYKLAFGMGLEITSTKQLYPCLVIRISQSKEQIFCIMETNTLNEQHNEFEIVHAIQESIKINIKIAFTLCI